VTRRQLWISLAVVVAVALGLSLLSVHGDIFYITHVANPIAHGHLNIYRYFYQTPALKREIANLTYPPLTYLFFGLAMAVGRIFGLFAQPDSAGAWLTGGQVFYLRLWYVPFLLLIGWVTRRFYEEYFRTDDEPGTARLAQVVGTVCPIPLFICFSFGQFDILPASLLYLGVFLLCRGKVMLGVLSVFAGMWLKNFPLVYLIIAFPVILAAYGPRRALGAMGAGIALTVLQYLIFRGPWLTASYLAFKYTNYDVIIWNGYGVRPSLSDILFPALLVLSIAIATLKTRLTTWQALVLLYAFTLTALLGPRFWQPQYVTWIAPVAILALLAGTSLFSLFSPLIYVGIGATYLFAVTSLFPDNVDAPMFILSGVAKPKTPGLGLMLGNLAEHQSTFWAAISVMLSVPSAILALRLLAPHWFSSLVPNRRISARMQLLLAGAFSLATYVGFIGLHLLNIHKNGPR